MLLEVLISSTPTDKTFFYVSNVSMKNQPSVGQIVKVKFRKKVQVGLIINRHKKFDLDFKLLEIDKILENHIFKQEILNSIFFLSNYSCNPSSLIFKKFMSGFNENAKEIENKFQIFEKRKIKFNHEQKKVLEKINKTDLEVFKVINLQGVTGSGKTRVYMELVKTKLKKGFQCLILVPEIILTKEWVNQIESDFGITPYIFHSSENKKRRAEIWKATILGKTLLIIGTRSALFLPYSNLGFIVVDEEQDQSYKQEDKLIFNARDFAIVRAKNSNCPIILCSATPSIETNYNSQVNKFLKLSLNERINKNPLPIIKVVNMKLQKSLISHELRSCIEENYKNKVQTMIFINKRGYSSFVICQNCAFVKFCKNCSSTMVLHNFSKKSSGYFLCHQCNLKENFLNFCENCGKSNFLKFPGIGIEKVQEEIKETFPRIKTTILSSDFLRGVGNYEKVLEEISSKKVDVIIGTQLISKGHNFSNIKTVGILNIDSLLNDIDFRSNEKAFQQIMQVSGRAGRKNTEGNVVIQTYQPHHPVIKFCKNYQVDDFYNWELSLRERKGQPPFSNFISIITSSKDKQNSFKKLENIKTSLKKNFNEIFIYGPSPSLIEKKNNFYRYRLLLKLPKNYKIQTEVKKFLKTIVSTNKTRVFIDVDPINFL